MTTPAVDIDDVPSSVINATWCAPGNGPPFTFCQPGSGSNSRTATWKHRPASGSSPMRPDGTRAPRPWSHSWGFFQALTGTFEWGDLRPGGWHVSYNDTAYQATNRWLLLDRLGAKWINPNSEFLHFPLGVWNAARTKLANKLSSTDPTAKRADDYSFGETLGEARQTAMFVAETCSQTHRFLASTAASVDWEVRQLWYYLQNGKYHPSAFKSTRRKWLKRVGAIPSLWLAFQFGLRPLLGDLRASAEALEWLQRSGSYPARFTVKAGHQQITTKTAVMQAYVSPSFQLHELGVVVARCHYSCTYEVTSKVDRTLAQLGLSNSFSVMFELTPWSWAVDYVLGVGNWLNSMFASTGLRFVEGAESLMMTAEIADTQVHPDPSQRLDRVPRGRSTLSCGRFERNVLSVHPVPVMPVWKVRIGLQQSANLAAALSQAIR